MQANHQKIPSDEALVTKALLNAAKCLDINHSELSKIVGISTPQLSRIKNNGACINMRSGKGYELALLFIRLFRSLDAITGGDNSVSALWIRNHNNVINGIPIEQIKKVTGLVDVLSYLDSRRARI